MTTVIAAFNIQQVAKLTGLSVSRLVDWDNTAFFEPSFAYEDRRSPYSRIYSFADVVGLRTLNMLRTRVSMQHLRKAAVRLREHSGRPWSELTLYVVQREVHFSKPGSDHVEGAVTGQVALPIRLESVAEDMRKRADELRKRDKASIGKTSSHRSVMGGVECVAGTRIPVETIREYSNAGLSAAQIRQRFPSLKAADISAAIKATKGLTRAA